MLFKCLLKRFLKRLHVLSIKNTSLIGLGWLRSMGSPRPTPTRLFKVRLSAL